MTNPIKTYSKRSSSTSLRIPASSNGSIYLQFVRRAIKCSVSYSFNNPEKTERVMKISIAQRRGLLKFVILRSFIQLIKEVMYNIAIDVSIPAMLKVLQMKRL